MYLIVQSIVYSKDILICFLFFSSSSLKQDKIKSHDDDAALHQKNIKKMRRRYVLFDAKNTDGICTSLLKANINYRQTIIAQIVKVD